MRLNPFFVLKRKLNYFVAHRSSRRFPSAEEEDAALIYNYQARDTRGLRERDPSRRLAERAESDLGKDVSAPNNSSCCCCYSLGSWRSAGCGRKAGRGWEWVIPMDCCFAGLQISGREGGR